MSSPLPRQARVAIVGGGVIGCSLAYHLTRLGWREVVLLEQGRLSGGTTWHAAGLVGQLRPTANLTMLIRHSARLYAELEAETGQATGWKACGAVNVASTPERLIELKRNVAMANAFGVEAHLLNPAEAGRMWPAMRSADLAGAAWLPGDGKVNPADLTLALSKAARAGGATIVEGVKATGIRLAADRVAGLITSAGELACEVVVNCAGLWAREFGRLAGVNVPLMAAEHMYIVTRPLGLPRDLPVMRDYDNRVYFKEEVGGLVMGGFEARAKPWGISGIPEPFEFQLLPEDWQQFEPLMQGALRRCPLLETAEVRQLLVGPESFTPDGQFVLGEAFGLRRYYVCAGFNSAGIASAGGAGKALAEWIVGDEAPMDLWDVDPRRFAAVEGTLEFLRERVVESLGMHYAIHWPYFEPETGRGLRRSPLYDRLADKGAVFGSRFGWERPNWFAPVDVDQAPRYAWGRQHWFPHSAREHRAAREQVALFDQSSFGKIRVVGPDAEVFLQRLCANDVAVPPGRVVYTQLLNRHGGIESDLTVTRLAGDTYLLVTGTAQALRDLDWLDRHRLDHRVSLTDVTGAFSVLSLQGPNARALLQRLSPEPLDPAAFPYLTARELELGATVLRAQRVSYVGELGFELYVPVEMAASLYDALFRLGGDLGLRDAGYFALESLRAEKAYRAFGHDLSPDFTPLEAGLGFAVKLDNGIDFLGREALLRQRDKGVARRLLAFTFADSAAMPVHDEPILRAGQAVGQVTSAAFGHSLGVSVALGYVSLGPGETLSGLVAADYSIEIAGQRFQARAHSRPPYDPTGERLRG
ncbi:MAG: FAD-dependent oxidoreductase [Alphaproteobacteria bacterium]|nr:FAD-dependent oxidoreductase [Alphaproteobacteria bacterium]